MHKKFYASGFLYHLPTQQILLQSQNNTAPFWSLFTGVSTGSEDPITTFQRIIFESVTYTLSKEAIHPIYDYFLPDKDKQHFVLYSEITDDTLPQEAKDNSIIKWFSFKQLYKLPLLEQARQDITVGQRVIHAAARDKEVVDQDVSEETNQ